METTERKCLECDGLLRKIQVIDQGHAVQHVGFGYTTPDATRGFWSGKYPETGRISSYLCEDCGAVRLYAEPNAKDSQ